MDVESADLIIVSPMVKRGTHVLVVDNDEASVAVSTKTLTAQGFKVTVVEGAIDALALISERKDEFDIILTEFYLRDMEGLEFLATLENLTELPIVVMCADKSMKLIMSCLRNGARLVYEKPLPESAIYLLYQFTIKRLVPYPWEIQSAESNSKRSGSPSESDGNAQSFKSPKQMEQPEVKGKQVEQSGKTKTPQRI